MALTNRQRRELRKQTPAKPRSPAKSLASVVKAKPEPIEKLSERDGLEWLIDKGRLKGARIRAARWYRRLYRDAPLDDGASIKSNLNRSIGSGSGERPTLVKADASIKLALVRSALSHHAQMIELLDAICGCGRSSREMARGDERRIAAIEAVLFVALDLVTLAQVQQEAAEKVA